MAVLAGSTLIAEMAENRLVVLWLPESLVTGRDENKRRVDDKKWRLLQKQGKISGLSRVFKRKNGIQYWSIFARSIEINWISEAHLGGSDGTAVGLASRGALASAAYDQIVNDTTNSTHARAILSHVGTVTWNGDGLAADNEDQDGGGAKEKEEEEEEE